MNSQPMRPSSHPATIAALQWILGLQYEKLITYLESFSSTAIERNELAQACAGTLNRLLFTKEPVSEMNVLGLAWTLRGMEDRGGDVVSEKDTKDVMDEKEFYLYHEFREACVQVLGRWGIKKEHCNMDLLLSREQARNAQIRAEYEVMKPVYCGAKRARTELARKWKLAESYLKKILYRP